MNVVSGITRFSPAKINLSLAVGPVRPDGFHPLESVVSRLDFGDHVTLTLRQDDHVVVECDAPGIPADHTNLAARAALRLREEIVSGGGRATGVTIRLEKQIPAGAGLGGGSSNAAAALLGLSKLWRLDLPPERLAEIGAELGSDVPLFLTEPGRMIVMRGRGEAIELFDHSLRSAPVILAIPPIHSSTAAVYRKFDELPPPPARRFALPTTAGDSLLLFNDLQNAAEHLNPALRDFRVAIEAVAERKFVMSGSGAAYFAIFAPCEIAAAEVMLSKLRRADARSRVMLARMI